jgi:two-component system chemotaxis response regulator CheY
MATVVVCDDDAVVRAAITAVCEDLGLEVVAETDSGLDAAEMVRRFGVDLLVLDLSLSDGSGERTLTALREAGSEAAVLVFSAYASDPSRLIHLGAREVIEKPDFDLLTTVLKDMGASLAETNRHLEDRRAPGRALDHDHRMWRSPSGVSSHRDIAQSLPTIVTGDAVIAFTIVGLDALAADVGPLLTADCRLAVARIAREQLRVQDLLHEAPEIDGFVALLRGGDARASAAVWSRIAPLVLNAGLSGDLKGAARRVGAPGAKDAVARAIGALHGATTGSPTFLSV